MPIARLDWITIDTCRRFPDAVFVFGDNWRGYGRKGQAVIRGEPNATGFRTKIHPGYALADYFADEGETGRLCRKSVDQDLAKLRAHLDAGRLVVLPRDGLGTNLARMPEKAPKLYAYMLSGLAGLAAEFGVADLLTGTLLTGAHPHPEATIAPQPAPTPIPQAETGPHPAF